jgi:hypothetical protein
MVLSDYEDFHQGISINNELSEVHAYKNEDNNPKLSSVKVSTTKIRGSVGSYTSEQI